MSNFRIFYKTRLQMIRTKKTGKKMSRKYLDLYEQMKNDIVEGIYKRNEKLPSKRTVSEESGLSIITVEHAYELLLEEGYIEAKERSGYYVIYSPGDFYASSGAGAFLLKEKQKKKEETAEKPDRETGGKKKEASYREYEKENGKGPEFSPSIYARTARRVLSHYEDELMRKSPPFGCDRLRKSIRDYLIRNRHIRVEEEQIIIGAGAEYLYGLIVRTLGRDVIYGVESPGYRRIAEVYETDGAKVELLPLGKDGIPTKVLEKTKARVLHITPYRSFPTGVTATAGKKREYLAWSERKQGILVEDDFESEFTLLNKPEDTLFSMDRGGRVIYVNTFTKTIGASIRVAYMLIPGEMIRVFENRVGFYNCPVPVLEQYIVAELIENGDFERHINRVRRQNRKKICKEKEV